MKSLLKQSMLKAIDTILEQETDKQEFYREIQKFVNSLKETPRLEAEEPIYYPGELEVITHQQRLQKGIPVPKALVETLAEHFGYNIVSKYLVNSPSK